MKKLKTTLIAISSALLMSCSMAPAYAQNTKHAYCKEFSEMGVEYHKLLKAGKVSPETLVKFIDNEDSLKGDDEASKEVREELKALVNYANAMKRYSSSHVKQEVMKICLRGSV